MAKSKEQKAKPQAASRAAPERGSPKRNGGARPPWLGLMVVLVAFGLCAVKVVAARRGKKPSFADAAPAREAPGVELRHIAPTDRVTPPPAACADPHSWLKPLSSFGDSNYATATAATVAATTATPLASLGAAHNASLLWGTYRPAFYFGVKSRTVPDALVGGLMWSRDGGGGADGGGAATALDRDAVRHGCHEGNGVEAFGWTQHDGRAFGTQTVRDEKHRLALETTFVKPRYVRGLLDESDLGAPPAGAAAAAARTHWASRLHVTDAPSPTKGGDAGDAGGRGGVLASAWFYLAVDCDGDPARGGLAEATAAACAAAAGGVVHAATKGADPGDGAATLWAEGVSDRFGRFALEVRHDDHTAHAEGHA